MIRSAIGIRFARHRPHLLLVCFLFVLSYYASAEEIVTVWPIDTTQGYPLLSTPYGPIEVFDSAFAIRYSFHTGVDLKADLGTWVGAVYSARVFRIDLTKDPYENLQCAPILIHFDAAGSQTVAGYAHLSRNAIQVVKGDHVDAGDAISALAIHSTHLGPHLHFRPVSGLITNAPVNPDSVVGLFWHPMHMLPYQDQSCPYIDGLQETFDSYSNYTSISFDVHTSPTEFDLNEVRFYFWHPTNPGLHWEIRYDYSLERVVEHRFSGDWPETSIFRNQLDTLASTEGHITETFFAGDPDFGTVEVTTDPYRNDPLDPGESVIRFTLYFNGLSFFPDGYVGAEVFDQNHNEACDGSSNVATSWGNTSGASPLMIVYDFSAESTDGGVLLVWTGVNPSQNTGIRIHRSLDPLSGFEPITEHALQINTGSNSYLDPLADVTADKLYYKYEIVFPNGYTTMASKVFEVFTAVPSKYALSQSYPNPFNANTVIEFSLTESHAGAVRVFVTNVLGQIVATIAEGHLSAGQHRVVWDGTNDAGQPVSSGIYFYTLSTGQSTETRSMVLLK